VTHAEQLVKYANQRWISFIAYYAKTLKKKAVRIVDAGCGTGTVSIGLSEMGFQVTGIDTSPEMLTAARHKADQHNQSVHWIRQSITALNQPADLVISTCDGVNHLTKLKDLLKFFGRVSHCLDPGGLFIFDINSVYKYQDFLGQNVFSWSLPGLDVVWTNQFQWPSNRASITLFSLQANGAYEKYLFEVCQRCYTVSSLIYYLYQSGMLTVGLWNNYGSKLKRLDTHRITFVAKKIKESR